MSTNSLTSVHSDKQCEPRHDKTNKVTVRPSKTQIRPESDQSLRCPHEKSLVLSYQLSAQRRLIRLGRVFAGRTAILLVLSCRGSCSN